MSDNNKGFVCAYIRVSSKEQNLARQEEILKNYNIERYYSEKVSGKNIKDRPEFNKMMDFLREGDTLYITELSRLGRSAKDLLNTIEVLDKRGVKLISVKENIDTSTVTGRLLLSILAAIVQFERETINERQKEGIAIAKKNGRYKGRAFAKYDKAKFERLYTIYINRGKYNGEAVSISSMARELDVSRPVIYRLLKEKGENNECEEQEYS